MKLKTSASNLVVEILWQLKVGASRALNFFFQTDEDQFRKK